MIVLKATLAQKKALEGVYNNGAELQFIQDFNNNWVVNLAVLKDPNFAEIKEQLSKLKQIEYVENEQAY
jgi:hypothetical protein